MGTFTIKVEVGDPQGQRWEIVEALVDTGTSFSVVPRALLECLGVRPQKRSPFSSSTAARSSAMWLKPRFVLMDGSVQHLSFSAKPELIPSWEPIHWRGSSLLPIPLTAGLFLSPACSSNRFPIELLNK